MRKKYWMPLLILFSSLLLISCGSLQTFTGNEQTSKNKEQKKDKNDKSNQSSNGTSTGKPVVIEFFAVW